MKGILGSWTMSVGRMLALACSLLLLSLAALPAHAQPLPPDDAPAQEPADRRPSTGGGPAPRVERQPLAPPMIGGGIWLAEGPGPAISGQVEAIIPGPDEVVGAVHTLAAHPSDPDILYAGGVNGGVWKTANATAASPMWTPLTDFETSLSIGALELDPTDPTDMTLVAGVGRYSSFSSFGGARTGMLLETTDGGGTWSTLPGFIGSASPAGISGVAPRGMDIAVSSNISDLFVCADIGIWYSTDGGASFTSVNPGSVPPGPLGIAFDLAGDPAVPATLYTGLTFVGSTCSSGSGFTNGIYKSTDTGVTWVKVSSAAMDALILDGTTNNIEIAVDGLDVYVDIIQSGRPVGVFHSPDGGTTWVPMDLPRTPEGAPLPIGLVTPGAPVVIDTTPMPHGFAGLGEEVEIMGVVGPAINGVWATTTISPTTFSLAGSGDFTAWTPGTGTWVKVVGLSPKEKAGSQGGIHASIRVDPAAGTTVYLGGDRQDGPFPNFIGAGAFSGRLFRGDTTVAPTGGIPSPQWENLTNMTVPPIPGGGTVGGSSPHADSREMVFDANEELIEGDDGGIYRRTSPGSSAGDWFSINGNMQVTEQHDVAYDAISDVIISGNQDTGTTQQQTVGGNLTWDSVSQADGGDVAVDDLTVPTISTRYASFQFLGGFTRREYDTSNGLIGTAPATLTPLGISPVPVFNFVNPVELNAIMPTALVLGAFNAIYESFDKGDTINALPSLGVTSFPQNAMAYGGISGGVPNVDVLWVGSGPVVQLRTAPDPAPLVATPTAFPGTTVTDIVMDPTEWGTAYVSRRHRTSTRPTTGGTTWTPMTGNLTDTRLGSVVIDPGPPGRLFAGGRDGVYEIALPPPGVPAVGPFVWGEIGTGLPNAPVWDMEWDVADAKLVVGTMGRGAWSLQENGACGGGLVPDTLTVRNQWVAVTQLDEACTQLTGGPALDVESGGDLTFKSPSIVLQSGFAVKTGGKFTADNSVP